MKGRRCESDNSVEARFCWKCEAAIPRPRPEGDWLGPHPEGDWLGPLALVVLALGFLAAIIWWGIVTIFPWNMLGLAFIVPGALFVLAIVAQSASFRRILVGLGWLTLIAIVIGIIYLGWEIQKELEDWQPFLE